MLTYNSTSPSHTDPQTSPQSILITPQTSQHSPKSPQGVLKTPHIEVLGHIEEHVRGNEEC
jgi:hypothetical protein